MHIPAATRDDTVPSAGKRRHLEHFFVVGVSLLEGSLLVHEAIAAHNGRRHVNDPDLNGLTGSLTRAVGDFVNCKCDRSLIYGISVALFQLGKRLSNGRRCGVRPVERLEEFCERGSVIRHTEADERNLREVSVDGDRSEMNIVQ